MGPRGFRPRYLGHGGAQFVRPSRAAAGAHPEATSRGDSQPRRGRPTHAVPRTASPTTAGPGTRVPGSQDHLRDSRAMVRDFAHAHAGGERTRTARGQL